MELILSNNYYAHITYKLNVSGGPALKDEREGTSKRNRKLKHANFNFGFVKTKF